MVLLAKSKYKGGKHAFADEDGKTAKLAVVPMMLKKKRIECRMLGFRRNHSLEYYGVASRLVITPKTQKCQMALFTAMRYCVPTVCVGDRGWGKEALVKDMSYLLGNVYLSYTLSNATSMKDLKSLLCGICSLGAWGCLRHFSSVRKGVLALMAETIGILHNAASAGLAATNINGTVCSLTYGWGIHFTASPAKMRDIGMSPSLRSLLRLVQFNLPEEQIVLHALFLANDFQNPKRLSRLVHAFLTYARLSFFNLKAFFGLKIIKRVLNLLRHSASIDLLMDSHSRNKESVFFGMYYKQLCIHLNDMQKQQCKLLITSIVSEVILDHDDQLVYNSTKFKARSLISNMDREYLISSKYVINRIEAMHNAIISGNNLIVVGAGSGYAVNATGGSADNSLPAHYHNFPGDDQLSGANGLAGWTNTHDGNYAYDANSTTSGGGKMWRTSSAGTTGTNENLPPYYALCYIMKT